MSTPRLAVDPRMQAWIDEQKKHFKPGDLDAAVRVMRRIRREKLAAAQKGAAA
jgi:hypothetical protein